MSSAEKPTNRTSMPTVAAMVDAFRAGFGSSQIKVIYAKEGANELGKLSTDRGLKLKDMVIGSIQLGKGKK